MEEETLILSMAVSSMAPISIRTTYTLIEVLTNLPICKVTLLLFPKLVLKETLSLQPPGPSLLQQFLGSQLKEKSSLNSIITWEN